MYFTKLVINKNRRQARFLLGNPQALHAAFESCFVPDFTFTPTEQDGADKSRLLWRLDQDSVQPVIYLVSDSKPDFAHIQEQVGWPDQKSWDTARYDRLLHSLATGQKFRFRLSANPVHNVTIGSKKRRVAHVTVQQKTQWLLDRCETMGISIPRDDLGEYQVAVTRSENLSFRRNKGRVTISRVTFDGVLEVTDPEKLRIVLTQGIGHAKAYGCGLMTLAVYRD